MIVGGFSCTIVDSVGKPDKGGKMFTALSIVFGLLAGVGYLTVFGDNPKSVIRPVAVASAGFITVWAMVLAVFCVLVATGRVL